MSSERLQATLAGIRAFGERVLLVRELGPTVRPETRRLEGTGFEAKQAIELYLDYDSTGVAAEVVDLANRFDARTIFYTHRADPQRPSEPASHIRIVTYIKGIGESAQEATQELEANVAEFISTAVALRDSAITRIERERFSVERSHHALNLIRRRDRRSGYKVGRFAYVALDDAELSGAVIDAAKAAGANHAFAVAYGVGDPEGAFREALAAATADAGARAEALASAAGHELGKLLRISSPDSDGADAYDVTLVGRRDRGARARTDRPDVIEISATVTLTFELKR